MLVNLSDVLTSEGMEEGHSMEIVKEVPLEMTCYESGMGSFDIISKSPLHMIVTSVGAGKAKLTGHAELTFRAFCDRCLTEVPVGLELRFERMLYSPDTAGEEEADDLSFMEGFQMDVEAFAHNEILINWPTKILCKEDCRGICPVCGQNRNMGDCGCDTFVPDPRMAVIQDIFNKNKEV